MKESHGNFEVLNVSLSGYYWRMALKRVGRKAEKHILTAFAVDQERDDFGWPRELERGSKKIQNMFCVRANGGLGMGLRESQEPKRLSFGFEQQDEG